MSRLLILAGVLLIAIGLLVRVGLPIGRLPGDVVIRRGSGTFYFPVVTCLVISAVLSLIGLFLRK